MNMLEISKVSYCRRRSNYQERHDPINRFNPTTLWAWTKPGVGLPTTYVMVSFCWWWFEV